MPTTMPSAGAEIIPFPMRPCSDAERLDRAIRLLNQALGGQLRAIRAWKQANTELAASLQTLARGFDDLDAALRNREA